MKEKQVRVLIGCADARDLGQIQLDYLEHFAGQFRKNGIGVEMHVIKNDPLMNMIVKEFNVNLIGINQKDLMDQA
ncbi:MAG TPA: hypothetical protein VEB86_03140 [Chryseosolibacter sp.]|nr:hypothetical protein [Chryseosolibacter sp.]